MKLKIDNNGYYFQFSAISNLLVNNRNIVIERWINEITIYII
jgi:hypothetical protein